MDIMDLPTMIMVEILSRLPIKLIFRCKTVCKLWYHLLTSDPFSLDTNFPCILLSDDYSSTISLLELKADDDDYSRLRNRPIMLSSKFHLPPMKSTFLVGSCNGFICLLHDQMCNGNHSIYINNPLLGEYIKLKLPEYWEKSCRFAYGFSFSEASGQYKVLRLVTRKLQDQSYLEVYTLGVDEKWRSVGQVPYPIWYNFGKVPGSFGNVNVNGVVHWLGDTTKSTCIYSFNIGTEEVKSLPPPPGLGTSSFYWTLAELGNCLCLSDSSSDEGYDMYVDIWWMKEYGIAQSWTKDRILTDSIPLNIHYRHFKPILIWKDGEILMQRDRGKELVSYNPKEKKLRKVNAYNCGTSATRYIPSFYSLKTVLGESFQVTNAYPKTEILLDI